MSDNTKPESKKPGMTYRGEDGRAHVVPEGEEAAREAEQRGEAPKPDVPGLAVRTPD